MDEFANILHRDYGLKPQGKSAPMTSSKPAGPSPFSSSSPSSTPASIQRTSSGSKPKNGSNRNSRSSTPVLGESLDEDFFFGSLNGVNSSSSGRNTFGSAAPDMPPMYDDVFGGPPKYASPSYPPMPSSATQQTSSSQSYDDIFRIPVKPISSTSTSSNKGSSFPVFDAPLYDDDIFGGVPGIRSASVVYDDVFSGGSTVGTSPSVLEDLLGVSENRDRLSGSQQPVFDSSTPPAGASEFDDLIPGFGGTEPAKPRSTGGGKPSQHNSSGLEKDFYGMSSSDPFDVLQGDGLFNVPQPADQPSASFSDSDASKAPAQSSGSHHRRYSNSDFDENIDASGNSSPHISTGQSPLRESRHPSKSKHSSLNSAPTTYASVLEENHSKRNQSSSSQADEQTRSSSSPKPRHVERAEAPSFHSPIRRNRPTYDDVEDPVRVPKVVENRQADEFWISVEDVKLVTEPTTAPPPSRRPPLPGLKHARRAAGSKAESNQKPSSRHESPQSAKLSSSRGASEHSNRSNLNDSGNIYDDLDEFASGVSRARKETKMDMSAPTLEEEIMEGSAAATASAMAMREAMERARAKLRDREKEEKESGLKFEEAQEDLHEAKEEEEKAHEQEEKERAHEREEREAKALREREEREKRHREREELERKREREKDRIAVERATQEARERAERVAVERVNAEARERAAAEAKQRAAVERVTAEARERAAAEARERAAVERAAVERATAEARERAAAEAREKATAEARERAAAERAAVERAAAEARERAAAEAREKAAAERAASEARSRAERAFVERVHAEARERAAEKAAADARERAERAAAERASAAREQQQRRSENDLESFFASSSRPGSAPRQRSPAKATSSQPSKGFATEGSQRSSTAASAVRKVTPTTSTDDWTSLFGPAVPAAGEFQEVEGESAERRRARLDRHQRTAERAAKALDEKNQRDLQAQREQAERHRAGDMLDAEIKRWAAGKEGNLRALLSTLQYVLWPECGWQAVSLTDLITAAAVKKVYRKATLCVHPDKVQQKGATIQQKYIAEKVFDLLKEAWNKFNSEELF